jgi:single-stranded DNA-binding protein
VELPGGFLFSVWSPGKKGFLGVGKFLDSKEETKMFNFCFFIGDLSEDPRVSITEEEQFCSSFEVTLMVGQQHVGNIGVSCHGWLGVMAAMHVRKGDRVAVVGILSPEHWRTGKGKSEYRLEVAAIDMEMVKPWP